MHNVISLSEQSVSEEQKIGRKAARLCLLGEYTPPGFVITNDGLRALLGNTNSSLRRNPESNRTLQELRCFIKKLGGGPVAVRSSHREEDLAGRSYAGIFQSQVPVNSDDWDEFWDALQVVYKSENDALAHQYRQATGIDLDREGMAIIIQKAIDPLVSGVAMSKVQRFGRPWLVLEYVKGHLGGLVDGRLAARRVSVEQDKFDDLNAYESFFSVLIPPDLELEINASIIDQIGLMLKKVAALFGGAWQVEWGVDNDRVWAFQVREVSD